MVWIALPEQMLQLFKQEPEIADMMQYYGAFVLIYNAEEETIVQWIEPNTIEL